MRLENDVRCLFEQLEEMSYRQSPLRWPTLPEWGRTGGAIVGVFAALVLEFSPPAQKPDWWSGVTGALALGSLSTLGLPVNSRRQ